MIGSSLKMMWVRETSADAVTMEVTEMTFNSMHRFLKVAIDGEVVQLPSPLKYSTRPKTLQVIVPAPQIVKA